MRLGFDGMNEVWELQGVLNEEHRHIVPDKVEDALFGVEFNGKAADITGKIGRSARTHDRRKADEYRGFFLGILQESSPADIGHGFIDLEVSMRSGSTRMHNTFGNTFMVEVGDLFPKMKVFQQSRAAGTGFQRVLIVSDAQALIGGQGRFLITDRRVFDIWVLMHGVSVLWIGFSPRPQAKSIPVREKAMVALPIQFCPVSQRVYATIKAPKSEEFPLKIKSLMATIIIVTSCRTTTPPSTVKITHGIAIPEKR